MASDNAAAWDRFAATYEAHARPPADVAHYGADIGTEADFRLLGDLARKRVLELGCGAAQNSIAFAKQGAIAIGVDASAEMLAIGRRLCEREEVRVELRQGDMADLAFLRADSVDLVFSSGAFGFVEDLGRVLRQVHRVLRTGAPLVFSLPHPAYHMIDGDDPEQPPRIRRSYFDRTPRERHRHGVAFTVHHHTIGDLHTSLTRASYSVDTILEPAPVAGGPRSDQWQEAFRYVPRTLVVRARKLGN
ncbi:MAG TPA: class I SAM-dependent methyltransferase [Acidimicrobiales bacterium]|nr:class I SAM-dependent methyltransferase [Acidimicrobiales bacterium]